MKLIFGLVLAVLLRFNGFLSVSCVFCCFYLDTQVTTIGSSAKKLKKRASATSMVERERHFAPKRFKNI